MDNTFAKIYALARQIPCGRVATYGQLATLAGNPRLSRIVGCAMSTAPGDVPCHRVVNRRGELCGAFRPMGRETHRLLLEMEGVPFTTDGRVDLKACQWCGVAAPEDRRKRKEKIKWKNTAPGASATGIFSWTAWTSGGPGISTGTGRTRRPSGPTWRPIKPVESAISGMVETLLGYPFGLGNWQGNMVYGM